MNVKRRNVDIFKVIYMSITLNVRVTLGTAFSPKKNKGDLG